MTLVTTDWNDRQINMVRSGPRGGAPVMLVHAVGLDLTYWSAQIEALGDTHDTIAFDMPGHGLTPGTENDWSLERATEMLVAVIRSTGAEAVHLIGLSVGGMIAQAVAASCPDLVRSLTLIDTASEFPQQGRDAARARAAAARKSGIAAVVDPTVERWFAPATKTRRPDIVDRVRRTLLADDASVYAAMGDMIAEVDITVRLARITCPTLILVGDLDPSSPPAAARLMSETIPDAEMHVIAGVSHMSILEDPATINAHLLRFLARVG